MNVAYLFALTLPLCIVLNLTLTGFEWLTLIYGFGVIPLVELMVTPRVENISKDETKFFDAILYLVTILHFSGLIFYFSKLSQGMDYRWGEVVALGISCGVIGINVAHELGHRQEKHHQLTSLLLLMSSLYTHFYIEHNKGHHRHVSTAYDPASARMRESLYHFLPRSLWGSLVSAYRLDTKKFIQLKLIELAYLLLVGLLFGKIAIYIATIAAIIGFLLLEIVNYIEHYGLTRKQNPSGRYEKVMPHHSWNSSHPLSRFALFELSRHSDHHANANRHYQSLRHIDDAPQLPTGYPGMMLLSLVPFLWFKLMNPRVEYEQKLRKY